MIKKLLLAILGFAFIVETGLTLGAFFLPAKTFELFKVSYNNDTSFLGYIIAWFLLLVTFFIFIAIRQVQKNENYTTICYTLAFWWIGLGIGIYIAFGRPDNLALDSTKGLLLAFLTWKSTQKK
jgi:archaellum biogenesis protein FlaJ (TadC family)